MPKSSIRFPVRTACRLAACGAAVLACDPALARDGLALGATFVADISSSISGGADDRVRYLGNLELSADADLGKIAGVDGVTLHAAVIHGSGSRPNDAAATLEGVNNIEVGESALRLFEAWGEWQAGPVSMRAGLYDLNSEFYATEAAGLLVSPPFGIGSELAATGSGGPSVFPSTALALRVRAELPWEKGYAQVAVLNARAGTLGDDGGIDTGFDEGVIVVGEVGGGDRLHLGLGLWTYTREADALASLDANGDPLRDKARGAYGLAEFHLLRGGPRAVTAFVRGGVARGKTVTFQHSVQAGVLVSPALIGRDDSAFSIGFHLAGTSDEAREAQRLAGDPVALHERAVEVTYSDNVTPFLAIQPDVQVIDQSFEASPSRTVVQANLRFTFTF